MASKPKPTGKRDQNQITAAGKRNFSINRGTFKNNMLWSNRNTIYVNIKVILAFIFHDHF